MEKLEITEHDLIEVGNLDTFLLCFLDSGFPEEIQDIARSVKENSGVLELEKIEILEKAIEQRLEKGTNFKLEEKKILGKNAIKLLDELLATDFSKNLLTNMSGIYDFTNSEAYNMALDEDVNLEFEEKTLEANIEIAKALRLHAQNIIRKTHSNPQQFHKKLTDTISDLHNIDSKFQLSGALSNFVTTFTVLLAEVAKENKKVLPQMENYILSQVARGSDGNSVRISDIVNFLGNKKTQKGFSKKDSAELSMEIFTETFGRNFPAGTKLIMNGQECLYRAYADNFSLLGYVEIVNNFGSKIKVNIGKKGDIIIGGANLTAIYGHNCTALTLTKAGLLNDFRGKELEIVGTQGNFIEIIQEEVSEDIEHSITQKQSEDEYQEIDFDKKEKTKKIKVRTKTEAEKKIMKATPERIINRFEQMLGVKFNKKRGKGGHVMLFKEGMKSLNVPTSKNPNGRIGLIVKNIKKANLNLFEFANGL